MIAPIPATRFNSAMARIVRIASLAAAALLWAGCGARTSLESGTAPPFDASASDAPVTDGHVPPGCDAGAREVWLLSNDDQLYVFDPLLVTVELRSQLDCPGGMNSMSVSRKDVGYVGAQNGSMFTVDLQTGHCTPTSFDPARYGLSSYGMGFVADPVPAGERLYIAPQDPAGQVNALGTVDVFGSFAYAEIGRFDPPLPPTEVTGTGDGRLYGVHVSDGVSNGELMQIDKTSAAILERVTLPVDRMYSAFDFAFWGGSFYIFMTYQGEDFSHVIRYTQGQGDPVEIATLAPVIIGAGVSTCAPL